MIDTATGESTGEAQGYTEDMARAQGWRAPETLYDLVEDLYFYRGGFADNSYLLPHSREKFYWQRKQETTLRNYFKPIIDATVLPVFNKRISRTIEEGALYEEFCEDCDGNGTSLTDFIRKAVTLGRIYPCFIVMDNEATAGEISVNEAREKREFPYLYMRRPQTVKAYTTNKFGSLTSITFCEGERKEGDRTYKLYTKWDDKNVTKTEVSGSESKVISTTPHGLGLLPVFQVKFSHDPCEPVMVQPEFIGIAKLNYALYNVDSEARDIARNGRFPTMYAYGVQGNSVSVGVHSFISIMDTTAPAPGILQPDVRIMEDGRKEAADIIASIYQLAQQSGITGVVTADSGVAKQWDFQAHASVLSQSSRMAQAIEDWCALVFGKYTNQDVMVDCKYPMEFAPTSADDTINRFANVLTIDMPEEVQRYLKRGIVDQITAGDDSPMANEARESLMSDSDSTTDDTKDSVTRNNGPR
jgi:hypothetical protein